MRPAILLALGGPLLGACQGVDELVPIVAPTAACAESRVESVACAVDGDTVDVGACGDGGERVRMLGVDTPETAKANRPADCYADVAHEFTRTHLEDREVRIEFDHLCTDIYGRTLGWLLLEGDSSDPLYDVLIDLGGLGVEGSRFEVLFNEVLVRGGYARVYEYDDDVRYYSLMEAAADEAEAEGRGLWGACEGS